MLTPGDPAPNFSLPDPEKRVIRAYGVAGPFGIGLRRATFLIDADKRVLAATRADLRLGPHTELVRQAVVSAQSPESAHSTQSE